MENSFTSKEFMGIKAQSCSCVKVPQTRENLGKYFPDCSFSSCMLYKVRERFLEDKFGADGHSLQGLFVKGDRIWHIRGLS
jgi:hypothetical protein